MGLALPILALATWRPAAGCALLAIVVPLTAGIPRNTVVPFLRPGEALTFVVAAVAVLEVASPSFHDLVSRFYEESPIASWDPVFRPSSLVTHYSAVAGFALLSGSLAVSLLVVRHRHFPTPWLVLVILANGA